MAHIAGTPKTIVIRTSRETLGLVVAATAMTFALSYAVHSKHDSPVAAAAPPTREAVAPLQEWAGHLAEVAPAATPAPSEPMTSASLTVPKSQLALPATPKLVAKPRPCPEAPCAVKTASVPTAAKRQVAVVGEQPRGEPKTSMIGMLNPLNHLPDMSVVGKPFTYAGGTVVGWFKRL